MFSAFEETVPGLPVVDNSAALRKVQETQEFIK
jgi:hypothetical protein